MRRSGLAPQGGSFPQLSALIDDLGLAVGALFRGLGWCASLTCTPMRTRRHAAQRCCLLAFAWSESPGTRRGGAGGCAPDRYFEELLGRVGVPLVPLGRPMRSMVRPSSSATSRPVAQFIAAQFDTPAAAAEGCNALVATGSTHFAAWSVTDKLDIPYVYAIFCPINTAVAAPPAAPKEAARRSTHTGWRSRRWPTHSLRGERFVSTRDTQRVSSSCCSDGDRLTPTGEEAANDGGSGASPVDQGAPRGGRR